VRLQLAAADVVMLSKTDLVDADTCRQVRAWIEAEIPGARLLTTADTGLFAELLFMEGAAVARPAQAGGGHGRMFATWSFSREQPLDGDALRAAIAALPPSVVRAKGIVRLAEAPNRRFVLQLVGRRWSLEEAIDERQENWLSTRSVVVCIGPAAQFDRAGLEALFTPVAPPIVPSAIATLLQREGRP